MRLEEKGERKRRTYLLDKLSDLEKYTVDFLNNAEVAVHLKMWWVLVTRVFSELSLDCGYYKDDYILCDDGGEAVAPYLDGVELLCQEMDLASCNHLILESVFTYYSQSPYWKFDYLPSCVDDEEEVTRDKISDMFCGYFPKRTVRYFQAHPDESPAGLLTSYEEGESYLILLQSYLLTFYYALPPQVRQGPVAGRIDSLVHRLSRSLGGMSTVIFQKKGHTFSLFNSHVFDCCWGTGESTYEPAVILFGWMIDQLILDLDDQLDFLPKKYKRKGGRGTAETAVS